MQSIGCRMKENYELRARHYLARRTPVILRLDGRAFHQLTSGFDKPFDARFIQAMAMATKDVAAEAQGCKLAYIQSDEASFLLTDYDTFQTDAWFGYNVSKMVSIAASIMSLSFANALAISKAQFDARAHNIPREEATNYFLWRALDWQRNSLQMYARAFFSHNQCHEKPMPVLHEMLYSIGKNWATDLPAQHKNGTFLVRRDGDWTELVTVSPTFQNIDALVAPFMQTE